MKTCLRALYPALLAVICWSPAAAQPGNLYAFGDSLVDNGNIPRLIGVDYPPPPYYKNRFSNGPTYAEYLPALAGLGFKTANDYAVGGAFAGPLTALGITANNLEALPAPLGEGFVLPLPSFAQEVQSFQAAGGHFGSGDVVTVWIGGNDYIATLELVKFGLEDASTIPGVAALTAQQTAAGVTQLAELGARRFVVSTLPDLARVPLFNTDDAAGQALAAQASNLHARDLAAAMALVHAQTGANIILINQQVLFNEVLANPAAYGKTNVTDACIDVPSCVAAPVAQQNKYLFWDDVHPTTGTHYFIAEVAARDLSGLAGLTVPAQLAAFGASAFAGQLNTRLADLQAGAAGFAVNLPQQNMVAQLGDSAAAPVGKISGFVAGNYDYGNRKSASNDAGFTYNIGTFAVGLDDRIAPGLAAGIALGYGTDHADDDGGGKIAANAYQLGTYATLYRPNYYANLRFAYGYDDYDNSRPGVISGISAKPTGDTYDIGGEAGYLLHFGQLTYGPVAGIDAARAHIGGYTERGDPALIQTAGAQNFNRVVLEAGATAATTLTTGALQLRPHVSLTAQDLLSGDGGHFDSTFADEPLVPLTSSYPKSTHVWAVLGGGIAANITAQLTLSADVTTTIAKADGGNHEVSAALHYLF